jgi:2-C-methyl-D-erythritol 4-phosphate cytidylyltransferase
MKAALPKQFLPLGGIPLALHSLHVFQKMPQTREIAIVCDPAYRHHFPADQRIKWALPGNRRQDSVYNGLQQIQQQEGYICIHDACRPFIDEALVERVFGAARECGASAAAMPVRYTVKEVDHQGFVINTPDRAYFWEVQTPQILRADILHEGFARAIASQATVTDDTSLAELIDAPVKLAEGSYANIKITTPDDLSAAEILWKNHG